MVHGCESPCSILHAASLLFLLVFKQEINIPYSRKYWRELNVGPEIAIAKILVDLNLVVRYGIAIHVRIHVHVHYAHVNNHCIL